MPTPKDIAFDALQSYYDHIYVLTIPEATERHLHIQQSLKGLQYTLFMGYSKNEYPLHRLIEEGLYDPKEAKKESRRNKELVTGQVCCSLGHRAIYADMLQKGFQKVLIFEDDVFANEATLTAVPEIITEIPEQAELVYWGWEKHESISIKNRIKQYWYYIQRSIGALKLNYTQIRNLYPRLYSKHLQQAGYHDATHAYGITASAAEKLIRYHTPIRFNADVMIAYAITNGLVHAYITQPKIFGQGSQYSDGRLASIAWSDPS